MTKLLAQRTDGSCHWFTPRHIIQSLGRFDLDVCAPENPKYQAATRFYTEMGLLREWFGRVWCNPPYGRECAHWIKKLSEHGNGIALIFARTDTAMFQDVIFPTASALCLIRGRVSFIMPNGETKSPAPAPSVLVAFGGQNAAALRQCGLGYTIDLKRVSP